MKKRKQDKKTIKSPSWVEERNALTEFGDRTTRAILAIYCARRSAKSDTFFVAPQIAKMFELSPKDLNWALDKLEGELIETSASKRGRFRSIRILAQYEGAYATENSEEVLVSKMELRAPSFEEKATDSELDSLLRGIAAKKRG